MKFIISYLLVGVLITGGVGYTLHKRGMNIQVKDVVFSPLAVIAWPIIALLVFGDTTIVRGK